jgi:hypothetical protein
MRDFGFVVWAIVVIAGVVSSIAQSARKRSAASGTQAGAAAPSAQRLAEVRRLAQTIAVRVDQNGNVAGPVRAAGTAPRPPAKPPAAAPAAAPATPAAQPQASSASQSAQRAPAWPVGTVERPHRALERLFRNRHALADAVVAAEVLGKPLALRNEYADR